MGYVILVILIFIAFGFGWWFGKKKMFNELEKNADSDVSNQVADIITKNKELMEKIRKRP